MKLQLHDTFTLTYTDARVTEDYEMTVISVTDRNYILEFEDNGNGNKYKPIYSRTEFEDAVEDGTYTISNLTNPTIQDIQLPDELFNI